MRGFLSPRRISERDQRGEGFNTGPLLPDWTIRNTSSKAKSTDFTTVELFKHEVKRGDKTLAKCG